MKPTAVTVSANYSDFLCWTAPFNRHLFRDWIVVTTPQDKVTQNICKTWGLNLVVTDVMTAEGGFNKWAGINEGLKKVRGDGWVLFLDSDIIIPHQFKRTFEQLNSLDYFDKQTLYGVDRLNCTGFDKFINLIQNPTFYEDNWLLTCAGLELGSRIVHLYGQQGDNGKFGGYKPLGFFQLAHTSSFDCYPTDKASADHCDIQFANQYSRKNRKLIEEFFAIHLESSGVWGNNWKGRKSPPFAPAGHGDILPMAKIKRESDVYGYRP
jgi:glycosyltransferase involved in cell wall biosynthesis